MSTFKAISKVVAVELINKSRGRIFSVTFKKKDNSIRVMNCRLDVKKHLKGGDLAYNPSLKGLKSVFDMQSNEYRMINLETIKRLSINGEHYIVEPFIGLTI
jgi:hypothetical protein